MVCVAVDSEFGTKREFINQFKRNINSIGSKSKGILVDKTKSSKISKLLKARAAIRVAKARNRAKGAKRRIGRSEKRVSELLWHQRPGHFSSGQRVCRCHECLECKSRKPTHQAIRDEVYDTPAPLLLFACDFFGKVQPQRHLVSVTDEKRIP